MTSPPSKARSWKYWPDTSEGRSEKGVVYLNIEPKYLLDYVAETAFSGGPPPLGAGGVRRPGNRVANGRPPW